MQRTPFWRPSAFGFGMSSQTRRCSQRSFSRGWTCGLCRRIAAIVIFGVAVAPVMADDPPTDAISREVSVFNEHYPNALPTDAISREVSVFNEYPATAQPADAISREVSVFSDALSPSDEATDAISRELSVFNDDSLNALPTDAISREVSVEDSFHCTGDFNGDFAVTPADIAAFADVLIGADTHPARRDAADLNCDGAADGIDIQKFVDCLLSGNCQ